MRLKKKLVLIDGNSVAYRAFFALPLLHNDKGIHTNAVYGFTMMLNKILAEEQPTHLLVAFDAGKTTFRHETFQEYKGGRQQTPPELSEQFPLLRELLKAYRIPAYELDHYEADDIIGTLAARAEQEGFEVKIISGDRDLTQLASRHVTVDITKKGITDIEPYTPETVHEKYGLTPEQIVDLKGLMGDKSDNIPGVPGIGEKTAVKLLKQFGTVENVLASIDEVKGEKLKENLRQHRDLALLSKQLASICRDAPVELSLDDIVYEGQDREKVIALFKELGFQSFLEKMAAPAAEGEKPLEEMEFAIVDVITEEMLADKAALVVEVMEENYHDAPIVGIALVNEHGRFFMRPETALADSQFLAWLADETKKKSMFDAKRAVVALKWKGIELRGVAFDLLLAAYLLNPAQDAGDIAAVAKMKQYEAVRSDEAVYGKGAKRSLPDEQTLAEHLVRKAAAIWALEQPFMDDLRNNEQDQLLTKLEQPLAAILAEMEFTGVNVDTKRLEQMGSELAEQLRAIEQRIYELAGQEFNINSPKQLGVILFEKLQLPVLKKTKTGYSTSADVLEKLAPHHEIVENILHYRQLGKLQSTYIEGLLKVVRPDTGKVHTMFNQALTQTGRLSSAEPNLQNIPIRLEEGRKIRQAFVPSEPDWLIFAADYSQIELRVLAHIADDDNLIEAFQRDLDIHTKTAMDIFHVSEEEVTANMRRQAKAVNFGIVYGISDYGLAQNLNITRKEAAEFIERYFASFPGVKQYMENIVQEAKQKGYVTTLLHRRRYLPDITSRNFNVRSFAERTAMNTPIQGSAADIIKKAMIDLAARLKEEQLQARLLLQVHDELILEAPKEEIERLCELVPEVMEQAVTLRVPLKVDYHYGPTWYDAK
ncbi:MULTISPECIES: DNA polymerase I [Geobacillus]|jgi:DNA polymerase-1|uniref:DNA polymerase I n=1 Tax=Geobacillus thermodenitrificans TaxID=33940 RepID=A0ABY9QBL7_GEOTD|nr:MULTISPECIES: DNA polymerase I [Geobacillus]ATO38207.1 DNA polymerase I [Geobacillus thermodenitrificans]MED0662798.1 DNA polymerase I [Geobacillus thermodenitrificans]MED3906647.1 DNA polymerase I [Geobacillus thermodenitrificans]NNU85904.1 DNA polymerase I [Geobacillus sp. MR]OQP11594.1 DNA polymerase I [Geobacillus sp. 47C-IIb]